MGIVPCFHISYRFLILGKRNIEWSKKLWKKNIQDNNCAIFEKKQLTFWNWRMNKKHMQNRDKKLEYIKYYFLQKLSSYKIFPSEHYFVFISPLFEDIAGKWQNIDTKEIKVSWQKIIFFKSGLAYCKYSIFQQIITTLSFCLNISGQD